MLMKIGIQVADEICERKKAFQAPNVQATISDVCTKTNDVELYAVISVGMFSRTSLGRRTFNIVRSCSFSAKMTPRES